MQHAPQTLLLADASAYAIIGILLMLLIVAAAAILVMTHLVGPSRKGPVKDGVYESGMDPIGDTRKRFNVRFYMVAMIFLVFDVEIVFFIPWATLFPRLSSATDGEQFATVAAMAQSGFGSGFLLIEMFIFIGILLVGYVYAWRKGAFQWN